MAALNPFLLSRHDMAGQSVRMQEALLCGHVRWPRPPAARATPVPQPTEGGPMQQAAAGAHAGEPTTETNWIDQDDRASLRAPCFYALYPDLWRRQERMAERRAELRRRNDTSQNDRPAIGASAGGGSSSSSPSAPPRLRLRSRSPSRLISAGALGFASTRLQHTHAFEEVLIQCTPHVSGHMGGGVGPMGDPPIVAAGADGLAAAQQAQQGPAAASVSRRNSRFNKPVADMGDYLSLLRSNLFLRNPRLDPLDDPGVISVLAQQHQLGREQERRKEREQERANTQPRGGAGGHPADGSSLSSPPSVFASRSSSRAPSSPTHRLTVDEADELAVLTDAVVGSGGVNVDANVTDPSSALLSLLPTSPSSPIIMRRSSGGRSRTNGAGGMRAQKPTMREWLARRNGNGLGAIGGVGDSTIGWSASAPSSPVPGPAAASSTPASRAAAAREKQSVARLTSLNERITSEHQQRQANSEKKTNQPSQSPHQRPSIHTLLATMVTTRKPPKPTPLPPPSGAARQEEPLPGVRMLLYRLQCDLGGSYLGGSSASSPSAAALSVYVVSVEAWFVAQMKELQRVGATSGSSPSSWSEYEQAFDRWKKVVSANLPSGYIDVSWERVVATATGAPKNNRR